MDATELKEAQIYVGTYKKYNEGSIFGKWLQLDDYTDKDDFLEACAELHKDEEDPELMFQDYEGIPSGMVSECSIDGKFWDLLNKINELDDTEAEAFIVYLDNIRTYDIGNNDIDDLYSDFSEAYMGQYNTEEDYARDYVEQCCVEIPEWIEPYFDYEAYARNLFMTGFNHYDGFVFYN